MAVDHVGRHAGSYIQGSTRNHENDGKTNNLGWNSSTREDNQKIKKVLAKQKQRDKSTTTIATTKRTAAIDSGRRIDPGASVPALARPQEEGTYTNPRN